MDLAILRDHPRRFTWGVVVNIFDVGRYTIVEGVEVNGRATFYAYVDGQDTKAAATNIEGAMLLAIANAQLGDRTKAERRAEAAAVLLGVES